MASLEYSVLPRFPSLSHPMEDLSVIMAGLQPCKDDNILALCGSGDQAFALLESGAEVHAVDCVHDQLQYARERVNYLRAGNVEAFRRHDASRYFLDDRRVESIRGNLDKLHFHLVSDVTDAVSYGPFTKIYLSSLIGFTSNWRGGSRIEKNFQTLASALENNGLVYVHSAQWRETRGGVLVLDRDLTQRALDVSTRTGPLPRVYRKLLNLQS